MLIATFVFAAAAFIAATLSLVGTLVFVLPRLRLPKGQRKGCATLILPLTGSSPGLGRLLQAIEAQSLLPRRLIVSVESDQDPAYRRVTDLMHCYAYAIEIVVADQATQCAQKCSNLIAALNQIDTEDQAIVLLDSDILPPPWWLSALVTPLLTGRADIVNGYRWPIVAAQTLGPHLAAAIDRAIAVLPRLRRFNLTWGGSLALSPHAIEVLKPGRILAHTLSDDCTIGEQAGVLGLRVKAPCALLIPTPMEGGVVPTWRFGRRQYQIIRTYRPSLWWLAFGVLSLKLLAWGLLLASFALVEARILLGALVAMSISGILVQRLIARRLGFADPPRTQAVQYLLAVFKPVVDSFHWSLVAAAFLSDTIRWGHITYRVTGPYRVSVVDRRPWR